MWKRSGSLLLLGVLALLMAACSDTMANQPKCLPLAEANASGVGNCALPLPQGVVARDAVVDNPALTTGIVDNQYVTDFPVAVTQDLLQRGQEQFMIYCRPCHGAAGYGDGILTKYNFPAPPSFHTDAVRNQAPGFFFNVISNGIGNMYSYRQQVSVPDRWAIVAYIRALQLSQHAPAASLPDSDRGQLP